MKKLMIILLVFAGIAFSQTQTFGVANGAETYLYEVKYDANTGISTLTLKGQWNTVLFTATEADAPYSGTGIPEDYFSESFLSTVESDIKTSIGDAAWQVWTEYHNNLEGIE